MIMIISIYKIMNNTHHDFKIYFFLGNEKFFKQAYLFYPIFRIPYRFCKIIKEKPTILNNVFIPCTFNQ